MKKYFDPAEIIDFIGILVTAFLIWFGGPLLRIGGHAFLAPSFVRLVLVGILFLLWLLKVGIRLLIDHQVNKKAVNILVKEGQGLQKKEIASKRILKKSLFLLSREIKKQSLRYGGKRKLFSQVPCFIMTGLPTSGKTTALSSAGVSLSFIEPQLQKALEDLRGLDSVRWWFTQEAVFLEMDIPEADTSLGYSPLLDILKRSRGPFPLNGLIIVEDITGLISLKEEKYQHYVNNLHHHLRSLYAFFGLYLPVYILFTKADLITGFNEYFSDFGADERKEVFGYTIEASDPLTIQKKVEIQHETFASHLAKDLLSPLSKIEDLQQIGYAINFPREILSLKPHLIDYLKNVFNFEESQKPYILQGLYFSSAASSKQIQEASLQDFLRAPETNTLSSPLSLKPYFLKGFFKRQIFFEINKVAYNLHTQKVRTFLKRSLYTIAACLVILYTSFSIGNYLNIKNHTQKITSILQAYHSLALPSFAFGGRQLAESLPNLDPLRRTLAVYKSDLEWYQLYTLYEFYEIEQALQKTLFSAVNRVYVPYLFKRIETLLEEETADPEKIFSLLKAYLAFRHPQERNQNNIRTLLTQDIQETYKDNQQMVEKLLDYLSIALHHPFSGFPLKDPLIEQKKALLRSLDPVERVYKRLKIFAPPQSSFLSVFPKELESLMRSSFSFGERQTLIVPYLYTLQGYKEIFQKQALPIVEEIIEEDWIVGLNANCSLESADKESLLRRLEVLYSQDYLNYWQNFLKQLKLSPTDTMEDIIALLDILAEKEALLIQLITFINQQVSEVAKLTLASNCEDIIELSKLKEDKHLDGIKALISQLGQLAKVLLSLSSSANPEKSYFNFTRSLQEEENISSHSLLTLKVSAKLQPFILQQWLIDLADRIMNLSFHHSVTHLDKIWKTEIYSFYEKNLRSTYPFVKDAKHPLDLKDLKAFLAPQGILEAFFTSSLKPLMILQEQEVCPSQPDEKKLPPARPTISSQAFKDVTFILSFYERFFDEKGMLSFPFQIQPFSMDANLASLLFDFSGETLSYRHGPLQKQTFVWKEPDHETSYCEVSAIDFKERESKIRREGPWALFKFLDQCSIKPYKEGKTYLLDVPLPNYQVQFLLQSSKVIEFLEELRNFHLPPSLMIRSDKQKG